MRPRSDAQPPDDEEVFEFMRLSAAKTPATVAQHFGVPAQWVTTCMRSLVRKGKLVKMGPGLFVPSGNPIEELRRPLAPLGLGTRWVRKR